MIPFNPLSVSSDIRVTFSFLRLCEWLEQLEHPMFWECGRNDY